MARLGDTSVEAQRVWVETFRRMPPERKWLILEDAFQTARILHSAGFRKRYPRSTAVDIQRDWLQSQFGYVGEFPDGPPMSLNVQAMQVLAEVIRALDREGIPYALGGSLASSYYGISRFTQDADLTVEPFLGKEHQLAACFGPEYYKSVPAMEQANRHFSSFNIIHTLAGFKVDFFVRKDTPFEQSAMARRQAVYLPGGLSQPVMIHSKEDVVLFKLRWYRLGQETSDQQWSDVLNMLKTKADTLDDAYLDQWAADLGVTDLLIRARQEALIP